MQKLEPKTCNVAKIMKMAKRPKPHVATGLPGNWDQTVRSGSRNTSEPSVVTGQSGLVERVWSKLKSCISMNMMIAGAIRPS